MTTEHPINPPLELIQQWEDLWHKAKVKHVGISEFVATEAAQWGADQQLEMDAIWVALHRPRSMSARQLNADMRPTPLGLREQALNALAASDHIDIPTSVTMLNADTHALIRKALETIE